MRTTGLELNRVVNFGSPRAAEAYGAEIDGVLPAEFDPDGKCRMVREWWHSSETSQAKAALSIYFVRGKSFPEEAE
jgi:hypothetical protein